MLKGNLQVRNIVVFFIRKKRIHYCFSIAVESTSSLQSFQSTMTRRIKNIVTALQCLLQISFFCSFKVPFVFCTESASGVFERYEGRRKNILYLMTGLAWPVSKLIESKNFGLLREKEIGKFKVGVEPLYFRSSYNS